MANSNSWGDGSENNSINWGKAALNAISWGKSQLSSWSGLTNISGTSSSSFDTDAQSFITATAITNTTQQNAIDTLVRGLKTDNIWTKLKAIYPFVGGSSTTHKYNLKDPRDLDAAFRLAFNGGITHSATGALPNGTTGYADTKYKPSIQIVDTDSTHFSAYFRTNDILGTREIGANTIYGSDGDSFSDAEGQYLYNLTAASYFTNGYGFGGSFVDSLAGQYIINRNGANSITAYKNGSLRSTASPANQGLPSVNMFLMGMNEYFPDLSASNTYYGKREIAFATLGTGLSNTDASNLYTRIQAFQTTLGRQV